MSSFSGSIHTGDYIRFVNDQCQFWHSEQAAKGLLHERGFIMQDVVEKASEFYSRLQELEWGSLVKDLCKVNEAWIILTPAAINNALGLPYPPEDALKAQDDENGQWLVDTLVVEEQRASTSWGITRTDIQSTHFTVEVINVNNKKSITQYNM
ncbi:hypothetical protein HAX54_045734 [Datura stramonium]|uniref:Uncharacterized protein n=1 Tax=Datura stramonium TaxID=4076 RepID=A0ABS8SQY4_DATST|nr:hypothetical protein [Datura stramonium]